MIHRRFFSTSRRVRASVNPADARKKKQIHWREEAKLMNNVKRALAHYDDFYASVFGKQWPSLRLALLSPPKFIAVPNAFTANIDGISDKLVGIGAYNVRELWSKHKALQDSEKRTIDMKKDLGRIHQLEQAVESFAVSKYAEEMDTLYQNAPTSKRTEVEMLRKSVNERIISDPGQAATDFVPTTKLKGMDDFTFDSEYFQSYLQKVDTPLLNDGETSPHSVGDPDGEVKFVDKSDNYKIDFPKLIVPHSFESGSAMTFPSAGRDSRSGLREYICVNGASLIPVMALDLRPNCNLLDLCAGPGTKSILSLMTMCLDSLVCNDVESSRLARVKHIFQEFTGHDAPANVQFTKVNARDYPAQQEFSRVLADVPCLNDRVSCTISDNSLFKPRRMKERLQLAKTQKDILHSALKAVDKEDGSTVVYSTCTLSPIENDGVVMNALKETEVPHLYVDLIGLVRLITPFERAGILKTSRTRCGVLVTPNTFANFGPMYVSRIVVKSSQHTEVDSSSCSEPRDQVISQ